VPVKRVYQFELSALHSAFQQAKRKAFLRSFLLGGAAIFGHEQNNGLQYSPRADCPCGRR